MQYKVLTKSVQQKHEMISPVQPMIDGKSTSEIQKNTKMTDHNIINLQRANYQSFW